MASITASTLNEHEALLHVLQCKSGGRSQDKFLRISNMNNKNIIDLPAPIQKSLDAYLSSRGDLEIIVISK